MQVEIKKLQLTKQLDYVNGHLRYGHKELIIDLQEEIDKYNQLSPLEKQEYFDNNSKIVIDGYCLNDYGENNYPIKETYF